MWHERSQDRKGKREGWFLSLVSVTSVCQQTTEAYLHLCRRPVTTCFRQVVFSCPAVLHILVQRTFFSYPLCPVGGRGAVAECVHKLVSCSGINCLVLVLKRCYTEKQRFWWEERLQVVHLLPVVLLHFTIGVYSSAREGEITQFLSCPGWVFFEWMWQSLWFLSLLWLMWLQFQDTKVCLHWTSVRSLGAPPAHLQKCA